MPERFALRTRRGAYAALALLTLIWGFNWIVMKLALERADPVVLNIERTVLAVATLFAMLVWQRRAFWPTAWVPVLVTGFFQTTLNYFATTMALAGGGAGRTSVLVFTMPFWTLVIAWPVLRERVQGLQWLAVAFAFAGLTLVVEPWNWHGDLAPKLWAVLSGFGWGAGTVCTKYFQRKHALDPVNFITWQMVAGLLPLTLLPLAFDYAPTQWSGTYVVLLLFIGVVSTAGGFLLWITILRILPAGTASLNIFAVPVIALVSSMLVFGERLAANEWTGIACIGAGLALLSAYALRANRRGEPVRTTLEGD